MPKNVVESLIRQLQRDIHANYEVGSRYLTIRQIAEKFGAAYGTAAKAVTRLVKLNMVAALPKSGITVKSKEPVRLMQGMKIALLSWLPGTNLLSAHFSKG